MTRNLSDLGREIDRRWVELGVPEAGGLRVVDLPQSVDAGQLLLGVGSEGSRLLVPVTPKAHRRLKEDTTTSGIQLRTFVEQDRGATNYYLDVLCPRTELRWLFTTFVADLLLRIERQPDVLPENVVRTCFAAWRSLFTGSGRRLSPRELTGLFGELTILERLLGRDSTAVRVWRGPLREPHDFRGGDVAVETKTTVTGEDELVQIHGLDQLQPPTGGQLYLAHLRVAMPADDGVSVPELVRQLRELDSSDRLVNLLAAAGYLAAHADSYEGLKFRLSETRVFAVKSDFPRLSPDVWPGGEVPPGLGNFRYTLDLASVSQPPLSSGEAEDGLTAVLT